MMSFELWAGMTIAVLTILVTTLITWQIWQSIDVNNRIKEMRERVVSAEKRDEQLQWLLEAFQIDTLAKAESQLGPKYAQSVNALRCFILSNAPSSYIPITNILSRLEGILNEIEKEDYAFVKERFAKVDRECNNYYNDIKKEIRATISIYEDIDKRIDAINNRRKELNAPYQHQ